MRVCHFATWPNNVNFLEIIPAQNFKLNLKNGKINSMSSMVKPSQILGGIIGGFDEIGLEMEAPSASSIVKQAGGFVEDLFSLVGDIAGVENKSSETNTHKFSSGTIEFNQAKAQNEALKEQKQKEQADRKRIFYQALKEDQQRAKEAKEKLLFEEEINDIVTNLPTEQKNELLHYQASYRDRSIYQKAQLRIKLIEQRKKADKQQKEISIAETKTKASAMQTAFEGGSGSQGGGQANLSFQATG